MVPLLELCGVCAARYGVTESWGPRNLEKMASVSLPLLIMHAEEDRIIPVADAELLYRAALDPDRVLLRVPRAGHNDIQVQAGSAYFEHIGALLRRLT